MRINVYDEEITNEVKLVTKKAADTGLVFNGVRLFLASPDVLHNTEEDDDRSAITLWWEAGNVEEWRKIKSAIQMMLAAVEWNFEEE